MAKPRKQKKTKKRAPQDAKPEVASSESKPLDPALLGFLGVSVALVSVRWYAARHVGFGDSEALYACYALHPAPAYLDHPGFVGQLARGIAGEDTPTPYSIHSVTAVLATALPWLLNIVARRLGATQRAALIAALLFAVVPVIAVGLFAITPDLPLAFAWLSTLGFAGAALEAEPKSARAAAFFLGAGVMAGVASSSKATGALLLLSLPVVYLTAGGEAAKHRRTIWPWLGLACAAVVLAPIISFEANAHWPMLHHRLVDTQEGAGFSPRNLLATLAGQFLYLSPVVAVLVVVVARDLFKRRKDDAIATLLFWTFALPFAALLALCLWSRVAEPHWLAPPMLALVLHAARRVKAEEPSPWPRRLVIGSIASGALFTAFVHWWVLSPTSASMFPKSVDPKANIATELYGWDDVLRETDQTLQEESFVEDAAHPKSVWVVGPHWVICAQLAAGMPTAHVGCAQDKTDFEDWAPRKDWEQADEIVFVTDNRFEGPDYTEEKLFPAFAEVRSQRVSVVRGGGIARTFRVIVLERRAKV